ncbi:MAG: dihydrolipoyl dehydrogenase [Bdellovibrionales bacterium]|nr:dihydrolipoyl dehydrogenase [Bdellovibrionales bacterium]
MSSQSFDICVVGSGPGGYVAAIRAAQFGKKVCIVERENLGGVCLNVGCIPSKAMISAAHFMHRVKHDAPEMGFEIKSDIKLNMKKLVDWKQSVCDKMSGGVSQLLKGNQVTVLRGDATFKSKQELTVKTVEGVVSVLAKNYIIATGSRPIEIPGFQIDEKNVLSSTGALAMDELPKSAVVIGGGYIGLEIGSYLAKLGCEVTVLEASPALLNGVADRDCVQVVERKLKKNGVKVITNAKAKSYEKSGTDYEVSYEVNGKNEKIKASKILLMVGRKPNSDQANLKAIGLQIDEKGFIKVNSQRRTNLENIYAIGDIAGQPMLAHKASYEGVLVAEVIGGMNRAYDVKSVPAVVFTDPEIASAGLLESECKEKGYTDLKIGKFPFAANGRAVSIMETDGFVKIIADAKTHVVLGVHMVGPEVSNLISEAVLAIEMGARLEDLAMTIHPHPTLGEVVMETAEAALGHAIHIIQKPLRGH